MKLFRKKPANEQTPVCDSIKGIRFLVIEDEESVRSVITLMLEKEGGVVTTAENGKEAMAMFSTARHDIIITDMAMPEKNGVDTIIELRQIVPPVGIIAMSGAGSSDKLLRLATAFDADVTLKKPFTRKELFFAIAAARKKMRQE